MEPVTVANSADVEAALLHKELVPPPPPNTLHPGPTADLRDSMARFSSGDAHLSRRIAVNRSISAISHSRFTRDAWQRTTTILDTTGATRVVEAATDIGFVVPVDALAAGLGVPDRDLVAVRADVGAIVVVIGRRQPSSRESDDAAARLMNRFESMGHDAVAAVSLLYQTHDASAALFASTLLADQTGDRRRPALASTTRTATKDATIGAHNLRRRTTIIVDLESSGFEFGLGPHGCPGREIAERTVVGMVDAVRDAGLEIDVEEVDWLEDRRPRTLPLRPKAARP